MKKISHAAHTLKKLIECLLASAFLGACSRPAHAPSGLATWDDVRASAEAFVLRGDSGLMDHTDTSGIPADKVQQVRSVLADWHGLPRTLTCTSTQEMTFDEFEAFRRDEKKELPEEMRNALLSSTTWNVKPEKMIVFKFNSKDPREKMTVTYTAGAYRTNNSWWFAANYSK